MEQHNNSSELENFVRRQLSELQPTPDAETWSKIAASQKNLNRRLRFRHYGFRAAMLLIGVAGIWAAWHFWFATSPVLPPAGNDPLRPVVEEIVPGEPGWTAAASPSASSKATLASGYFSEKRPQWYLRNPVKGQSARFEAETGILYKSQTSGNMVRIGGNILIHADGSPVSGPVDLFFREYRNLADFAAAGMPMHYQDERGTFFFNSGGMFEVRVSQNGEQLRIAPGKNYTVVFEPTHALKDAALYYLPDATDRWVNIPPSSSIPSEEGHGTPISDTVGIAEVFRPRVLSADAVARDNNAGSSLSCLPDNNGWAVPDTADEIDWMQESIRTGYAYAQGTTQPPEWFRKNADKNDLFFSRGLERGEVRIVYSDKHFFPDDLSHVFTELAAFKGYFFIKTTDSTDAAWRPDVENSVDRLFSQPRIWKRVQIYPEEDDRCTIVVGDENEELRVPARLTRDAARPLKTTFQPGQIFAHYEQLLKERQRRYMDEVRRWKHFTATAAMFQSSEEWCMTSRAWFDYFDKNKKNMRTRYDSLSRNGLLTDRVFAAAAIKAWKDRLRQMRMDRIDVATTHASQLSKMAMTLSVSDFGTYNWDQVFRLANPERYLRPHYRTPSGESVLPVSARVVDRRRKLFFSLPNPEKLIVAPGQALQVVVLASNGRIYYLPADIYAASNLRDEDEYSFQVEDVTEKVGNTQGWVSLLGI